MVRTGASPLDDETVQPFGLQLGRTRSALRLLSERAAGLFPGDHPPSSTWTFV